VNHRSSLVIYIAIVFISCKKVDTNAASTLYGNWINISKPNDTLHFMKKNNKDILRYNGSFNTGIPAYTEVEYIFRGSALSLKLYAPALDEYYPVSSFTWKQLGREFEVQAIQLLPVLSSTLVYYTYRKI